MHFDVDTCARRQHCNIVALYNVVPFNEPQFKTTPSMTNEKFTPTVMPAVWGGESCVCARKHTPITKNNADVMPATRDLSADTMLQNESGVEHISPHNHRYP
jgi:hypothetical protein